MEAAPRAHSRTGAAADPNVIRTMRLHYGLEDAGWATVTLESADQRVEMAASYLHDSLRDLASAARALVGGAAEVRVVFMDEPGEHELIMRRASATAVDVEILWHGHLESWKMEGGQGKRKLLGSTSVADVRGQILSELKHLLHENGEAGYRRKWVEHDFPVAEMRELEEAG